MFIKNQTFKDENTLLEMLFDFGIGEPSDLVKQMIAGIDKNLQGNTAYIKYRDSLQDEDDRAELYIEERDLLLSDDLMKKYDSFTVDNKKLYGIKGPSRDLLYYIDLVWNPPLNTFNQAPKYSFYLLT